MHLVQGLNAIAAHGPHRGITDLVPVIANPPYGLNGKVVGALIFVSLAGARCKRQKRDSMESGHDRRGAPPAFYEFLNSKVRPFSPVTLAMNGAMAAIKDNVYRVYCVVFLQGKI